MSIVKRSFGYKDGQPALIITPVNRACQRPFYIVLNDAYKYREEDNRDFQVNLTKACFDICRLLHLDIPRSRASFVSFMAHIADVVQEGLDDLVKMKPDERVCGERRIIMPTEGDNILYT